MRIVFMGTPEFAVPSLTALLENGFDVVCVVTQPDRPKGRGHAVVCSPVKSAAERFGIPVFQPEKIRLAENVAYLRSLKPDLMITAAFGQILSQEVLDSAALGTINVHASLLPAYRGAAPVNWAIVNGEAVGGVTLMYTDAGIDTGDMIESESCSLVGKTADEALEELSHIGAGLLVRVLKNGLENAPRIRQDASKASYYPVIKKEMAAVDWSKPAICIERFVRGMYSKPGAYTFYHGAVVKLAATTLTGRRSDEAPGTIAWADEKEGLGVACGDGACLSIEKFTFPGTKPMTAKEYLRGRKLPVGDVLGTQA